MVIFRCTQKLAKKFKLDLELNLPETSRTVLGDWYFNYFTFARKFYLLGVSEISLLPVVIPARESGSFPERFCRELGDMLQLIGVERLRIERELSEMRPVLFGKTESKVVLGCQNDCIRIIKYIFRDDPAASLLEHSLKLSRMPFRSIGYADPQEVAVRAFQSSNY